ncbi:MAG: hypothetical protein Tsb0017_12420 [Geothermobacteraceae bacterium]
MPEGYNLVSKFAIRCAISLVLVAGLSGHITTSLLERATVASNHNETAAIVRSEIVNEFDRSLFSAPAGPDSTSTFEQTIPHLTLGPDVVRVKIWGPNFQVLWADDPSLIGKSFPDNHELTEAYRGEIVAELSDLHKGENVSETGHNRLLELYIPVQYDPAGPVDAVIEVYKNIAPLQTEIRRQRITVWMVSLLGFLGIYLALVGLIRRAARRIDEQTLRLRASEAKYRDLVTTAQDGILALDRSGTILFANPAVENMFGYRATDLVGQPLTRLMPEQSRPVHNTGFEKIATGDQPPEFAPRERIGCRRDGNHFPIEVSYSWTGTEEGPAITAILRDISERKALQKKLIESEKQASAAVLAGSIGHEINNSVGGLLGFAELLKKHPERGEFVAQCAEMMLTQIERLSQHGRNLLALSKPPELKMGPIDLNQVLQATLRVLETSGLLKQQTIETNTTPSLPLVQADEQMVEQAIRNLIINAVHAMDGPGVLKLETRPDSTGTQILLTVADTGPGMEEDVLARVFEPFYTTKGEGKGTGLGLYIVRQVMDRHGGRVDIDSQPGRGTRITLSFPVGNRKNLNLSVASSRARTG